MLHRLPFAGLLAPVLCLCVAPARIAAADPNQRSEGERKQHFQAQSMGTLVDLTLWTDDAAGAQAAAQAVFEEFHRLDQLMSN